LSPSLEVAVLSPQLGKALQAGDRKMLGRPYKLPLELRRPRSRGFVHADNQPEETAFELLKVKR
ncbi:MAG: hypothetical protein WAM69_08235, partial [Candidatus Sulfotelmatobacter sp.]